MIKWLINILKSTYEALDRKYTCPGCGNFRDADMGLFYCYACMSYKDKAHD